MSTQGRFTVAMFVGLAAMLGVGGCGPPGDDIDAGPGGDDAVEGGDVITDSGPMDAGETGSDASVDDAGDMSGGDTETSDISETDANGDRTCGPPESEFGEECEGGEDCPDSQSCNGSYCEPSGTTTYKFVQIADTSSSCEACDLADPGSDLFAVELRDSEGTTIGWGEILNENLRSAHDDEPNNYTNTAVIDGSEPTLDEGCPAQFNDDSVVALGCGGNVAVGFKSTEGSGFVTLETGQEIVVHEYGANCDGSTVDSYKISPCAYESQADFQAVVETDGDGDWPKCNTAPFTTGAGKVATTIAELP